jgi:Tol biopolymer transport system component
VASRATATVLVALVGACLVGCGSGGMGGSPVPSPGATFTVGSLQVGTASAAGFKTLTLDTPGDAPVGFTVLYGSGIIRLREMGYGQIALSSDRDGDDEIYVMNADGSGSWTKLTTNAKADVDPTWAPGGDQIAFASDRQANWEIYKINADGTGVARLTNAVGDDLQPAWSPAGDRIAFMSDRAGNHDVWVMDADGSSPTRLTTVAASDEWPSWSPDGRQIAFASNRRSGNWDIYVMNADGSGQTRLTANPALETQPAWSVDGLRIAFVSGNILGVMDTDGNYQRQLTNSPTSDVHPAWCPDGRKLVFGRQVGAQINLFATNADGRDPRNLTVSNSHDDYPAWCPALSAKRTLIGPRGSDGGSDPPFGSQRPFAVVGMTGDGLASAATIGVPTGAWGSIRAASLDNLGGELAGLKITASRIDNVQEDLGRGLPPRTWDLTGPPNTGAALVFLSPTTGRIASVVASADKALATDDALAERSGGQVTLRGSFTAVYDCRDPQRNLASQPVHEVVLDGRTGKVLAVR